MASASNDTTEIQTNNDFQHLKGYRPIKLLGQGGMGRVYLAEDETLGRQIAIKVLHHNNESASYAEDVLQEARTLAKINHPNVVQVHSVIEQPGAAIIMEYVPGITLKKYQLENSLSLQQKIGLLYQIAQGLQAIHQHNIVHKDIKADNILLDTRDGQNIKAKLTDFGIAARLNEAPLNSDAAKSEKVRGSLPWMSPEQLQNQSLCTASDMFSFGLLAFQLLADKHAFAKHSSLNLAETPTETTATDIAQAIVNDSAMNASDITPALPPELAQLLNQLLDKTPDKRPSSKQVCDRLQQVQRMLAQQDILGMETQTIETLPISKAKKSYTLPAIAVACVALISILVAWFMMQPPPTRYVAVLKPQITETEPLSSLQKNLVLTSIEDALQQLIISTPHLMLIPQSELDDTQGDIALIGKSTGADDIVAPELICNAQHCELVLSLYNQTETNNAEDAKWHTTNRLQNPIYLESYQPIYQFAQTQLTNLYSGISELNAKSLVISEEDYAEYLEIYYQVYTLSQSGRSTLEKLESLIAKNRYFFPLYSVFLDVVLRDYLNSKDQELLIKANNMFEFVPNELKHTTEFYIHSFYLALESERYVETEALLAQLEEKNAENEKIHMLKASYFQAKGDYQSATSQYILALKYRPSASTYYHIASNYWWLGNLDNAIIYLLKLKNLNPNIHRVNNLLAVIYLQKGDLKAATHVYEEIVLKNPNAATLTNLAIAKMLNKEYSEGLELAEKALTYDPNHAGRLINYADALLLAGHVEKSKGVYSQVLSITRDQTDLGSLTRQAQALLHLNEVSTALSVITEAKKIAPSNPNVLFISAMILAHLRENHSAINDIKLAIEQGLGKIWFYFPWFDSLCATPSFSEIISIEGKNSFPRC
ncbi:serine/threonine-protein kinase [Planctobacterium marinum]|uniref:Protein kinase domain-containing protein n=1 Tax=Planctobacterium marinum TaxID=1631968 RepID=A0AA48KQZ6_9ALTE|nr:hypothetical protein MACH26_25140 [Planctobacterium marinum]